MDSVYGVFKYFIHSETPVVILGSTCSKIEKAIVYNTRNTFMERCPSILKKRLLRKQRKIHKRRLLSKCVSTQTPSYALTRRIETILESPRALDFIRIIDCFNDKHGSVSNTNVHFLIN